MLRHFDPLFQVSENFFIALNKNEENVFRPLFFVKILQNIYFLSGRGYLLYEGYYIYSAILTPFFRSLENSVWLFDPLFESTDGAGHPYPKPNRESPPGLLLCATQLNTETLLIGEGVAYYGLPFQNGLSCAWCFKSF